MIRNIVFDLGNVLLSFRPAEYLNKHNFSEEIKTTILADIFGSEEWQLLDSGSISISEAIDRIDLKSSLKKQEIAHIFNLRTSLMFPLPGNIRMLPELKKEGFRLFYLSNFPKDIFEDIKSANPFFHKFDGGIISAEVNFNKPDPRIYKALLEKYDLRAEECLFIDDLEANVMGAEAAGMKGLITFGSEEISGKVYEALRLFGC